MFLKIAFTFIIFIHVCVCVYVSECPMCAGARKRCEPPGARVTDGCEPIVVDAGTELRSSETAASTLNH